MCSVETTPTLTSHANEEPKTIQASHANGDGLKLGVKPVGSNHPCEAAQGTGGPTGHRRIHGGDSLLVLSLPPLSFINLMQQNNVEIVEQALGLVCSLISTGNFNIKS